MLRFIYRRHANVVPVMARGVSELRQELAQQVRRGRAGAGLKEGRGGAEEGAELER